MHKSISINEKIFSLKIQDSSHSRIEAIFTT